MTSILVKFSTMAVLAVGLTACGGKFSGGGNGQDIGRIQPGSVNDPTSLAYFQQTIGDRVLFAVNQNSLSPEASGVLDGQANWLLQNSQYVVTIEGHADEQGTREYNLALGARRASAARNYLVDKGIADNRVKTVTYGKERPLAVCSSEECWSQNRRAVTIVGAGLGS
jgi:peptidoglycan-associated lipoprotein